MIFFVRHQQRELLANIKPRCRLIVNDHGSQHVGMELAHTDIQARGRQFHMMIVLIRRGLVDLFTILAFDGQIRLVTVCRLSVLC